MSQDKYTKYVCPTCGKKAKVLGNTPDKCEYCSKVICPKCGKMLICPECTNKLNDSQLNRLKKAVNAAERTIKFGRVLTLAGLVLMVPIMYYTGTWFMVIISLCVIPIGSTILSIRMAGKIPEVLDQFKYENPELNNY